MSRSDVSNNPLGPRTGYIDASVVAPAVIEAHRHCIYCIYCPSIIHSLLRFAKIGRNAVGGYR
jgi:hypothetical protein